MRPKTIAEVAKRANAEPRTFDAAVREFLDRWQTTSPSARQASLFDEPSTVGRVQDAYLAAVAEHLALSGHLETPAWTEKPGRFLTEPYFAGGLESLKAILLVESPLAFRRRLIFISADALSRPHGDVDRNELPATARV